MTTTTAATERTIRETIEARLRALRAKDAAGAVAHHTGDYTQYSMAPPLVAADADAAGLQAWLDTWDGPFGFEMHDLRIAAAGDVAYAHGLARMSGRKHGQPPFAMWFRVSLGLRREDGAWKVAHEHESVPFYMDGSFQASTDLVP